MPAEYTLVCYVDQAWVERWRDGSVTFYFARTTNGSDFDVIASTSSIDPSMTVKFEDEYCIAAVKTPFEPGVPINPATSWADIEFGQKYVVDKSWTDRMPLDSSEAPANGFLFQNTNVPAGVIVAKKFQGTLQPVYCSPVLLPPHGTEGGFKLVPDITVAVWFQMDDSDVGEKFVISMDENTKEVNFDADGAWSIVS